MTFIKSLLTLYECSIRKTIIKTIIFLSEIKKNQDKVRAVRCY